MGVSGREDGLAVERSGEGGRAAAGSGDGERSAETPDSGKSAAGPVEGGRAAAGSDAGERTVTGFADGKRAAESSIECAVAAAGTGEGGHAAADSGGVKCAAAGSSDGKRVATGSGKVQRPPLRTLDYPCTKLLRLRRLLAYLGRAGYVDVYHAANGGMRAIFHVSELVKQIKAGQLWEALSYDIKFVPLYESSDEATILALFLRDLMAINNFASGDTMAAGVIFDWLKALYKHPVLAEYPCFATIVDHVLFLRPDLARTSLDWQLVRIKAAELVEAMVYKTPELSIRLKFPVGRNNLYNVVPIGSSHRRKREIKNTGQKQSANLAQFYLKIKRRLPSSDQSEYCANEGSVKGQGEALIALLDLALQAGRLSMVKQGYPPEHISKDVYPLEAVLSSGVEYDTWSIKGHQPEHSWKRGVSQRSVVASPQIAPAMKRSRSQASHRTAVSGQDSKKPRTTRKFREEMVHQPGTQGAVAF